MTLKQHRNMIQRKERPLGALTRRLLGLYEPFLTVRKPLRGFSFTE